MNGLIGTWLVSLAGPAARSILKSLGFGFVTFAALTAALNTALDMAHAAWDGMGGAVLGLVGLAGGPEAMGIIAGALVTRVAMQAGRRLSLVT